MDKTLEVKSLTKWLTLLLPLCLCVALMTGHARPCASQELRRASTALLSSPKP